MAKMINSSFRKEVEGLKYLFSILRRDLVDVINVFNFFESPIPFCLRNSLEIIDKIDTLLEIYYSPISSFWYSLVPKVPCSEKDIPKFMAEYCNIRIILRSFSNYGRENRHEILNNEKEPKELDIIKKFN